MAEETKPEEGKTEIVAVQAAPAIQQDPPKSAMQLHQERAKAASEALLAPKEKKSDAEIVLQMMNQILSKDNIEQKSRQTFDNVVGISRAYVLMESMIEGSGFCQLPDCDGFSFIEPSQIRFLPEIREMIQNEHGLMASLKMICDQMTVRLVSLDGKGRDELIKLAQAFSFTIQQHEHERDLADRLLGQRGPGRR